MRQEIWEARAAKVRECADAGMSQREIAEAVGITTVTVRTYLSRFGISTAPANAKYLPALTEAVRDDLTLQEVANKLGCHYNTVRLAALAHGISLRHGSAIDPTPDRSEAIASMYKAGKTLQEIGDLYGITRERIRQILRKRTDVAAVDGGATIKTKLKKEEARAQKEAECLRKRGCTLEQLHSLREIGRNLMKAGVARDRTPIGAFAHQRCNARKRGIRWSLTLWQWWTLWQQSGKWEKRGRGGDLYVMCRFGDAGAYEIGNVYIATLRHNSTVQPNNPTRKSHPGHAAYLEARAA